MLVAGDKRAEVEHTAGGGATHSGVRGSERRCRGATCGNNGLAPRIGTATWGRKELKSATIPHLAFRDQHSCLIRTLISGLQPPRY